MGKSYPFLLVILCLSLITRAQNSSLNFTGSNYVLAGPDVINPNGDFSIEFWTYVPGSMNNGVHTIMSEGSLGSAFFIGYGADGTIQVGDFWGPTGVPMVFDKWTHIALTYSLLTSVSNLYVDGKLMTSTTAFSFTDDQPFRIGVQVDLSQPFTGLIDEVKAWNSTRSAAQVKSDLFGIPDLHDNNLIAYYKMDDGSGTTATNSSLKTGSNQDGAITGDPGGTNSWASSPIQFGNNALVFDGVDDQVNIPALADNSYDLSTANGGTVEFWVNPTSLNSNWSTILGNRGTGGVRYSFHLSATQIGVDNGTTINTLDYALPTGANNWTHIAFVLDGANPIAVYVGGIFQGNISATGPDQPLGTAIGQDITIGTAANTPRIDETTFNGGIDEVRIWNYKRSGAQIAGTKDFTLSGNESGLIGQFSFDMGVSSGNNANLLTALDNSTLANHGTLANFALTGATSNFAVHPLTAIPLPVILTAFTANRSGNEAVLHWQTATEQNTRNFIIERSSDGNTYTDIGTTPAAGNSSAPTDYSFIDPEPGQNNNFYRLKQVDLDDKFVYSPVRVVSFPTSGKLIWYTTGKGSADILLQQGNNQLYALFDAAGRLLRTGQLFNGRTSISQLPPGIYFVRAGTYTATISLP